LGIKLWQHELVALYRQVCKVHRQSTEQLSNSDLKGLLPKPHVFLRCLPYVYLSNPNAADIVAATEQRKGVDFSSSNFDYVSFGLNDNSSMRNSHLTPCAIPSVPKPLPSFDLSFIEIQHGATVPKSPARMQWDAAVLRSPDKISMRDHINKV
jgi:hypothetical protein